MALNSNQRASAVGTDSQKAPLSTGAAFRPEVVVVLAQQATGASAPANVPVRVFESSPYGTTYGQGSPLTLALDAFFEANNGAETWALPVTGTGTASDAAITASTGTLTKSLTGIIKTKGLNISFSAAKGADQDDVATAILNALTAEVKKPFSASIDTGVTDNVVDLLASFTGVDGDDITLDVVDLDGNAIESADYGIGITVTGFANGAGLVNVATAISNITESIKVTRIISQFSDTDALDEIEGLGTSRRDPQIGERVLAYHGSRVDATSASTLSSAVTSLEALATARINDKVNSLLPMANLGLPVEGAAELVGQITARYQINPGQPPRGLQLLNPVNRPATEFWFSATQRNSMYIGGIANFELKNGVFRIMDLCNMYHPSGDTKLAANQPIDKDDEYITAIGNMLYDMRATFENNPWLAVKFLAESDVSSNTASRKLSDVRAAVDSRIDQYVNALFLRDAAFAKENKGVGFNDTNPERVDILLKGKLAQTGRIFDAVLSLSIG